MLGALTGAALVAGLTAGVPSVGHPALTPLKTLLRPSRAPSRAPRDLADLASRAAALEGRTLGDLAAAAGISLAGATLRTKGKAGVVVERALGATSGSAPLPDFPELGVELKTIPLREDGQPRESTFVSALSLADADRAEWSTSPVRRKLSRVLWVPVLTPEGSALADRRIGRPLLWEPTAEQEAVLAADFDTIMGLIGIGRVESLDARTGRWLQARPKAAHGRVRTAAFGPEDEPITALPRGFYLRARFTGAILRDAAAVPG
jgi:DNA mismatch repair protein MutH